VLDLHHESTLEIHEHATDTAGAVESVFALFHLFGYRFAPRIRDLGGRKLFIIDKQADYGPFTPLMAARSTCDWSRRTGTRCCGWRRHSEPGRCHLQ
jgi:TnpA family transposase